MNEEGREKWQPKYAGIFGIDFMADGETHTAHMVLPGDDEDYIAYVMAGFKKFLLDMPGNHFLAVEWITGTFEEMQDLHQELSDGTPDNFGEIGPLGNLEELGSVEELEKMPDLKFLTISMPDMGKPEGTKH